MFTDTANERAAPLFLEMNGGKPFTAVRYRLRGAVERFGVLDSERETESHVFVWEDYRLISTAHARSDFAHLEEVQLTRVPSECFECEDDSSSGGPTKWTVMLPLGNDSEGAVLVVDVSCGAKMSVVEQIVRENDWLDFYPHADEPTTSLTSESSTILQVRVRKRSHVPFLQTKLGEHHVVCVSIGEGLRDAHMAPEKILRGARRPVRSVSNWKQPFLPEWWTPVSNRAASLLATTNEAPHCAILALRAQDAFTIPAIASQILSAEDREIVLREVANVPIPLRYELTDLIRAALRSDAAALDAEHAERRARLLSLCADAASDNREIDDVRKALRGIGAQLERLDGLLSGCIAHDRSANAPNITATQSAQLLSVTYMTSYSPTECSAMLHSSKLILFRYLLHGWRCRFHGQYDRSGKHIGYGKQRRVFKKNAALYQQCAGDVDVLNRTTEGSAALHKALQQRREKRVRRCEAVDYSQTLRVEANPTFSLRGSAS